VFRTVGDQVSLWEAVLPAELLKLPDELARVDGLLDDRVFFAPFVPFFDPRVGRPSTPMETYLRLMFLKFRYRLGYESLCREVSDSITWRRFCRIPLDGSVPHPTTLMKLTTRCGSAAVDGLNEALLAKAAEAKLLRTNRVPTRRWCRRTCVTRPIPGCWPRRHGGSRRRVGGSGLLAVRCAPGCGTGRARRASALTRSRRSCARAPRWAATRPRPRC
jgi:IS5 family transposase